MNLSQEQLEKQASIRRSSMIFGAIVGVIAGAIMLWILSGQSSAIRLGGALVVAVGVMFLVYRASFNSGAKSAKCEACGAAFSISRTGREEVLKSSTAKEEREELDDGAALVRTWTEEVYTVTETYTCANCGNEETKTYETTRRKDEKEDTISPEPVAPDPAPKASGKSGKSGKANTSARGKSSRSKK